MFIIREKILQKLKIVKNLKKTLKFWVLCIPFYVYVCIPLFFLPKVLS